MEHHLKAIAQSYDRGINLGKKGINLYKTLPEELKNDPDYRTFQVVMAIHLLWS